jgi:nicotinamidase-related amidase
MDALLVVDVQKALIEGAFQGDELVAAINRTISKIREAGGLIIFIQHCHSAWEPMKKGQPGWEVDDRLDVRPDDIFVEKTASDAFYDTDLETMLNGHGVDRVLVTGMQSEYCVDATCRAALSRRYLVTLVSDAHTTSDSHLTASQIIDHHNRTLGSLAHPTHAIEIRPSNDI